MQRRKNSFSYGKERVQGILSSPEPTFGNAAVASLGVELPEFGKRFRAWLDRR
jgi:hypothetical protein